MHLDNGINGAQCPDLLYHFTFYYCIVALALIPLVLCCVCFGVFGMVAMGGKRQEEIAMSGGAANV